jgi:phosphomannomutase
MIDRLATRCNSHVYETPVGFNHIADYMLKENVLIGGEESGGISFQGHIPEGDGVLMGLLLVEIVASSGVSLYEPAYYQRKDLRLNRPVAKARMTQHLLDSAPSSIGGYPVTDILTVDGVKYLMEDDSWLLIRPSGTEPVLRVYAEGRSQEMVKALLAFGEQVAETVV